MLRRLSWVFAATLLAACGSSNSELTNGIPGSHVDASAGSGGSGSSSGGTAGSGGASGGAGGSVSGGAGGSAGATGGTGGSAGATGGTGGSAGATGGAGGSGGVPGTGSVKCGQKTCAVASQSCCFGENVTPYCYKKDAFAGCKCTGTLCEKAVVDCDGPEDCNGGQVCCATKGITGKHFDRLSCTTTCKTGLTTTAAEVCHLNASGTCPSGMTCASDARLPGGYGLCQ